MITNFQEYTEELTDDEKNNIVPTLVRGLQTKIGKSNAITSTEMIKAMGSRGIKLGGAKLRKLVQYIRMTGLVERLVATSNGYYICNEKDEMEKYINSLLERAGQINMLAKQMDFQFKKTK